MSLFQKLNEQVARFAPYGMGVLMLTFIAFWVAFWAAATVAFYNAHGRLPWGSRETFYWMMGWIV